ARLLTPAVLEDGRADLVAGGGPSIHPVSRAELGGQRDRAVQRRPAHQFGVQEVAWLAPDLPDALVLLLPAVGGRVRGGSQELLGDRVELAELLDQPLGGAEQFAV